MPRPVRNEWPKSPEPGQGLDQLAQMFKHLPRAAGNIAVNFFKDRFRRKGWHDTHFEKWPERKRVDPRRKRAGRRAVLVKTGRLRRSIRVSRLSFKSFTISTDVPYAPAHNEGLTIDHPGGTAYFFKKGKIVWVSNKAAKNKRFKRTKPHKIPIPKRKFIGRSKLLDDRITKLITKSIEDIILKK